LLDLAIVRVIFILVLTFSAYTLHPFQTSPIVAAAGGAVLGWLFATGATRALSAWSELNLSLAPDRTVLLFALAVSLLIALVFGLTAGYFGRWVDAVLSRFIDIVLGIPFLLAAIVLAKRLSADPTSNGVVAVTVTLGVLGWTTAARIMRSSVISSKNQDYVAAARMLGAGHGRLMMRHILPNSIASFIVVLTILLGINIASEATLSFLGIGLKGNAISWGIAIAEAGAYVRTAPAPLIWPSVFLALTVLAFIMLGDAVRDAFDPKLR